MSKDFFSRTTCERCGGSLSDGRTCSMFNTQTICMTCKEKERQRPDYRQAADAEIAEVRKGNRNFKGIGLKD